MKQKLLVAGITLLSIAIFLEIAFSSIEVLLKAGILLLELGITGWLIHKIAGIEGYYGLLILKGEHGFDLMTKIAKNHLNLVRGLADFGLTLGFGLPYGYFLFKKSKKFALQAIIMLLIFSALFLPNSSPSSGSSIIILLLGAGLGLFGIAAFTLAQNAWNVLTVAGTPAGVSLLIPGVTVPYEAVIAIIIIATVHELAHGVLAHAEKIKIKSSGALLYGFLPVGAFVEPDEEEFKKTEIHKKRRILIAGSTSNFIFFLLFLGISFALVPILSYSVAGVQIANSTITGITAGAVVTSIEGKTFDSQTGYRNALLQEAVGDNKIKLGLANNEVKEVPATYLILSKVLDSSPNKQVLTPGESIYSINKIKIYSTTELKKQLEGMLPGQKLVLETSNGEKTIFLDKNARIGASFQQAPTIQFKDVPKNKLLYDLLVLLSSIVFYTFLLNFILASVNLLPIFLTDGHQLVHNEMVNWFGERNGKKIALAISVFLLLLIIINALPALNISFPWLS